MRLHKIFQHITSINEATYCKFIFHIIYDVASIFNNEIKVYLQYEISESYSKRSVDWIIKVKNTIIIVTEVKKENINQNIV